MSSLLRAKALEQEGKLEAALEVYKREGASKDAARVLMSLQRFEEAGHLLMRDLGLTTQRVDRLQTMGAAARKQALSAAICFGRAGKREWAVDLFLALGENTRAADILERAGETESARRIREGHASGISGAAALAAANSTGRPTAVNPLSREAAQRLVAQGKLSEAMESFAHLKYYADAARLAEQIGMLDAAASYYSQGGQYYEGAACLHRLGETSRSLEMLVMVPRDDPNYRRAAISAISLGYSLNLLDFRFDQFLARFMRTAPESAEELDALYTLGRLYQRHNFAENAAEAFQRIVAASPGYRDTESVLAELRSEARGSAMVYEQIVRDDEAFHRAGSGRGARSPSGRGASVPPGRASTGPVGISGRGLSASLLAEPGINPDGVSSVMRTMPMPSQIPPRPVSLAPGPNDEEPVPPLFGAQTAPNNPHPTYPTAIDAVSGGAPASAQPGRRPGPKFMEGTIVHERYQLVRKIGSGGMALVFEALDLELNEPIAIKIFSQPIEQHADLLRRFKQEIVLTRQVAHQNVVRVYDIGVHAGYRYLTMELLRGADLKAQLGRPMGFMRGLDYLAQACAGLAGAHDRMIVHRDIKPNNLFITQENVLKLMDFGIAKRLSGPGHTAIGTLGGTPLYIAPEQVDGFERVTPQADLYSLGVIAYEMFTGRVPFLAREVMTILKMHMQDQPTPPRVFNPAIPPDLEAMILCLLEKAPARRYPNCQALREVVLNLCRRLALTQDLT